MLYQEMKYIFTFVLPYSESIAQNFDGGKVLGNLTNGAFPKL